MTMARRFHRTSQSQLYIRRYGSMDMCGLWSEKCSVFHVMPVADGILLKPQTLLVENDKRQRFFFLRNQFLFKFMNWFKWKRFYSSRLIEWMNQSFQQRFKPAYFIFFYVEIWKLVCILLEGTFLSDRKLVNSVQLTNNNKKHKLMNKTVYIVIKFITSRPDTFQTIQKPLVIQ